MAIISTADVRIQADGTGFDAQVRRIVQGSSGTFRQSGDEAAAGWLSGFGNRMRGANLAGSAAPAINSLRGLWDRAGGEHGDAYSGGLRRGIQGGNISGDVERQLNQATRPAERAGRNAGSGFSSWFGRVTQGEIGKEASKAATSFHAAFRKGMLQQTVVGSLTALISQLTGALFALGSGAVSAAGSLAGIVPVMGSLLQAGGTLAIVFKGIGKAVGAGFKIADAAATDTAKKAAKSSATFVAAQRAVADARQRIGDVVAANAQKMTDANRRVNQAERDLIGTQQALTIAQRGLTAARKEAEEELQQLAFSTESAALAEQRAQLSLEDAYAALQKVKALPPDDRARREAELSFAEAELNYREAKDNASDLAAAQNEAAKKGVNGTKAYTAAQNDVIDAQNDINDAEDKLAQAREARRRDQADGAKDLAKAQQNLARQQQDLARVQREAAQTAVEGSKAATTAAAAYQLALSKLSPSARSFVTYLVGMRDRFNDFKKAVQEPFFAAFNGPFKELVNTLLPIAQAGLAKTSGILGELAAQFSGALVDNADEFGGILAQNNRFLDLFTKKTNTGKTTISNLVTVFLKVYKALEPLATQFGGFIVKLSEMAVYALDTKKEMQGLTDFFGRAGKRASQFADIFGSIIKILLGLGKAAGPATDTLLQFFVSAFNQISNLVRDNQKTIQEFFDNSAKNIIPLFKLLGKVALAFLEIGKNSDFGDTFRTLEGGIEPLKQILENGAKAAPALARLAVSVLKIIAAFADSESLNVFFGVLNDIADVVVKILDQDITKKILGVVGPVLAIASAFGLVLTVIKKIGSIGIGSVLNIGKPVAAGIAGAGRALGIGGKGKGKGKGGGGGGIGGGGDGGVDAFAANLGLLRTAFQKVSVAKDIFIKNLDVLRRRFATPIVPGPAGKALTPVRAAAPLPRPQAAIAPVRPGVGVLPAPKSGIPRAGALPAVGAAGGAGAKVAKAPKTGGIGKVLGGLGKGLGGLLGILPLVMIAFELLMPVLTKLYDGNEGFKKSVDGIIKVFGDLIGILVTQLAPIFETVMGAIGDLMAELAPIIAEVLAEVVPILLDLAKTFIQILLPVIKLVIDVFGQLLAAILPPLLDIVKIVIDSFMPVFLALVPLFLELFRVVLTTFGELAKIIMPVFTEIIGMLITTFMPIIQQLGALFVVVFQTIGTLFQALMPIILQVVTIVVQLFGQLLIAVLPIITQLVGLFVAILIPAINALVPIITFAFKIFAAILQAVLPIVIKVIGWIVALLIKILIPAIKAIVPVVTFMANIFMSVIRNAFAVFNWLWQNVLNPAIEAIKRAINRLRDNVANFGTAFKRAIKAAFDTFRHYYDTILVPVFDAFRKAMGKLTEWAEAARDGIGNAFHKLADKIKSMARDVLNAINTYLIGPINGILIKISPKLEIPKINTRFAEGGPVRGPGGPKDDKVPALLSNGEWVIKKSAVDRVGAPMMHAINSGQIATFGITDSIGSVVKTGWNTVKGVAADTRKILTSGVHDAVSKLYDKTVDPGISKIASGYGFLGKIAAAMLGKLKLPLLNWAKEVDNSAAAKKAEPELASGGGFSAPGAGSYGGVRLSKAQLKNAAIIASVASKMKMGSRGILVGLMTAMQESTLKNINYGDRDSLGLFQQRGPWGSAKNRTTPEWAAGAFYRALKRVKGWQNMGLGKAAQRVQISAFPGAYSKWEKMARAIASKLKKVEGDLSIEPGAKVGSPASRATFRGKTFSRLFIANLKLAEKSAHKSFAIYQGGFRPTTSYSGSTHNKDAIDTHVNLALLRAFRKFVGAMGDRTGLGNWAAHMHGVPAPGRGYGSSSAKAQYRDYVRRGGAKQSARSAWGLATGGTVRATDGGILALIGEGGKNERVEPLDRQGMSERDRAIIRDVVEQLANRTQNTPSYGTPSVLVRVYIGDTELRDIVSYEVETNNENLSNMIRVGRRTG